MWHPAINLPLGLTDPVRLMASASYIDVEHGHAAPAWFDMDADGKKDLVVGQFEGGKARIYTNIGEKGAPKFGEFQWLSAGGGAAQVSYG